MARVLLEICVDSPAALAAAVAGGADRIELGTGLELGGLSPAEGMLQQGAQCGRPVYVMVRPRSGDFVYDRADGRAMMAEVETVARHGLAGVVLGATRDGKLDCALLSDLVAAARGMGLGTTLHRAFDLVDDQSRALETAIELGFDRVLTSGGMPKARLALPELAALFAQAAGRIVIMPASGITAGDVPMLAHRLPLTELHASASVPVLQDSAAVALGFAPEARRETHAATVAELRAALDALPG